MMPSCRVHPIEFDAPDGYRVMDPSIAFRGGAGVDATLPLDEPVQRLGTRLVRRRVPHDGTTYSRSVRRLSEDSAALRGPSGRGATRQLRLLMQPRSVEMELRMLGRSGLVSTLCLGGNVFRWTIDEKRSIELLTPLLGPDSISSIPPTYIQHGSQGIGEAIIGNWMKIRGNRASVVIARRAGSCVRPKAKNDLDEPYLRMWSEAAKRTPM